MAYQTFDDLQEKIQTLYQSGDYPAALALADEEAGSFPEYAHMINYWRIVLAARMNDATSALRTLDQVLSTGFWYGEALLRKNPSLKALQGQPAFEALVEKNRLQQNQDGTTRFPMLVLRDPQRCIPGGAPCPTMLTFHTNAGIVNDSLGFWQVAAREGWLVGAVQSTQGIWKGAYVWDDLEQAEAQAGREFQSLLRKYPVDPERTVIAGHGRGGEVAAWLSLKGSLPASGMLLIGPEGTLIENPDGWGELLSADHPGLRAYILAGEEDARISSEAVREFASALDRSGVPTEYEDVPHAGHEYLPEYESAILRALEFLAPE